MGPGWLDYPTFDAAGHEGALFLRQDVRQLDALIRLGVDGFFRLVDEGRLVASELDHVVCHYSSQFFRTRIFELLAKAGASLPEDKWFSNLTTRGNVGSASVFVLLEELVRSGRVRPGQQIFFMIPESGRFVVSYVKLTAVGDDAPPAAASVTGSDGDGDGRPAGAAAEDEHAGRWSGSSANSRASGSTSRRASTGSRSSPSWRPAASRARTTSCSR